jgi:outer membrane protein assembly factor BamB
MNVRKCTIILAVAVLSASFSFADDWANWRGPNYDGISRETDINPAALSTPVIVWEAKVGTGYSAVSVAKGKAYTVGNINKDTDVVYCFDGLTGKELWTFTYPEALAPQNYEGGCNATPAISDGKVYTLSKTGKVFCLDAAAGTQIWKQELPGKKPGWGLAGSPVIVGDLVILNVGVAGVALNKTDGQIVWKSDDQPAGYASAVPFQREGKKYIAMFCEKTLEVLETQTGKSVMTYPWETSFGVNAADPIISGDEIFITSGYNHGATLLKMTPEGLRESWQNKNMRSHMSGPVLIDGYLYGFDDNQLVCVEWKTGRQMWVEKAPKKGALCAVGDKLIVMGESGTLSIVQTCPEGYKELSSAQILSGHCWTMPVLSNGKIYVRNAAKADLSRLVCVDVQKRMP